jgi:hypothetical protein
MKKYLAYYENEWPANIAELTSIENKPFVGYLGGTKEVKYTVIPKPAHIYAWEKYNIPNDEIWYTTRSGNKLQLVGGDIERADFYTFELEPGYVIDNERNNEVLSHEFDEEKQVFVIKCSQDIVECNLMLYIKAPSGPIESTCRDISSLYLPNTMIYFRFFDWAWDILILHTLVLSSSLKEIPSISFSG